ncbi:ABC transporter ATP-binding protein [Flammeovirgaceae bacterium SG7u.111]|nr:ABC transporter ATP-binding protein [Flammeovirgaceae bacterium SG7u.132]WPO37061.1 ABC transporter ATP-binding protein [Flammeovirgaceae bacterium SG7u.111]
MRKLTDMENITLASKSTTSLNGVSQLPKILRTNDLQIGYKSKKGNKMVAEHLNLELYPGQLVCLLGANGAGKSTLMRTLAGIQAPLKGGIWLEDIDIHKVKKTELAKKLSLVLTENMTVGNLSVYSLLSLGRYPYVGWFGQLSEEDKRVIKEAVKATGIEEFLDKQISQLSDGERQKVLITRALVQDTPLIMLDEPTAHLDLPNRVEIIRLLREMARKTGKAIVLSTHELDLALQAADNIWLMMPNQSMVTGMPEDLILQGTFEKAFQKGGFDFCKETGTFKVNIPQRGKTINLKGDKAHYFWTKRALEREGFSFDENADLELNIHQNGQGTEWVLYKNGEAQKFSSVASTIRHLSSTK